MSALEGIADELAEAVHVADVPLGDIDTSSYAMNYPVLLEGWRMSNSVQSM
jgi:hypothetical protein